MINVDMRLYDYFTFGENNEYGQAQLSKEPQGKIKMAIYISSQSVQDNINYKDCKYIGLTNSLLDDSYVIQYGDAKLKVMYINPKGRVKQVFLTEL